MEYASQFIQGLDGPASLTFLGLLFVAFLIGLLPAGLTYAFRIRDMKKRMLQHVEAHRQLIIERELLEGQLLREQTKVEETLGRLKKTMSDRAAQEAELTRLRKDFDSVCAESMVAQITTRERDETIASLKNKIASLQGQISSLRSAARPQSAPSSFDLDVMASLKTARTKLASLEERVKQLTADNELLRRERAQG